LSLDAADHAFRLVLGTIFLASSLVAWPRARRERLAADPGSARS
jgi:hypothetical protein